MSRMLASDLISVIRGLQKVTGLALRNQFHEMNHFFELTGTESAIDLWIPLLRSYHTFDAQKSLKYFADRAFLLKVQNKMVFRSVIYPSLRQYTGFTKSYDEKLKSHLGVNIPPSKSTHMPFNPPSRWLYTSARSLDELINDKIQNLKVKPRKTLVSSKQRHVPSSRMGRIVGFGNLFVGLGLGAAAELAKRSVGFPGWQENYQSPEKKNVFLNDANIARIVDTLCRMRGAALKLGQMLSIQDNSLISPKVQELFERVRQSADFMPTQQMYSVINQELGPNWKEKVVSFEETPFAAASIGQVHRAVLKDGRIVAIKIQYPGIQRSIETDVANILLVLKQFDILPRGLFAEEAIRVAKRELHWECDYIREAAYATKFKQLLANEPGFVIPNVVSELSAQRVYTTEFFDGLALDDCVNLPQDIRNWIGEQILGLCLKEVFIYNIMQTDPNWSNFLYCGELEKIVLLDFGASREFSRKFVDEYLRVIASAVEKNTEGIIKHSKNLGFLTGYETKAFIDAHTEAVSILGEAFSSDVPFDFGHQSTTYRINRIIPVMLEHRLTPPPSETYSLHRKMSGCFLLCSKLRSVVNCRDLFLDILKNYQYARPDQQPLYP